MKIKDLESVSLKNEIRNFYLENYDYFNGDNFEEHKLKNIAKDMENRQLDYKNYISEISRLKRKLNVLIEEYEKKSKNP